MGPFLDLGTATGHLKVGAWPWMPKTPTSQSLIWSLFRTRYSTSRSLFWSYSTQCHLMTTWYLILSCIGQLGCPCCSNWIISRLRYHVAQGIFCKNLCFRQTRRNTDKHGNVIQGPEKESVLSWWFQLHTSHAYKSMDKIISSDEDWRFWSNTAKHRNTDETLSNTGETRISAKNHCGGHHVTLCGLQSQ